MKLLRITADEQLRQPLAVCTGWARAIWDWYQRPSIRQVRGRKLLREWLSPEQLAQTTRTIISRLSAATPGSDTGFARELERTSTS
jgi:hypothetical protein